MHFINKYSQLFILLLVSYISQIATAQQTTKIDSLIKHLKQRNGIARIQTMDSIFNYYYTKNIDSAEKYAKQMLIESKGIHNDKVLSLSYNNMGIIYLQKKNSNKAKELIQKAIQIEKKQHYSRQLASSYRIIAGIYNAEGNINKSIDYVYKALHIFDSIKDYEGVASCYNNIGILHKQNRAYNKAIKSYLKGLLLVNKHKITHDKVSFFNNLSIAYRYIKKYDSSYYYLQKAINTSQKNNNYYDLSRNYLGMAKLLMDQNLQNDSIRIYLDLSLKVAQKHNLPDIASTLISKGKWYYLLQKYDSANIELQKGLNLARKQHDLLTQQYALYYLYKSKQKKGAYKEAIKDLEDFVDVQDSINFNEAMAKINNLQEKFDNEKKQLKIAQLEKVKSLDQKIKWMLFIIIAGILAVSIYIIRRLLKQRKQNRLEKERIEEDLKFKNKQLTSQALMMMQKNTLLSDILASLQEVKDVGVNTQKDINELKRKLKRSMHSEDDWELFKQYFELINKDYFTKLKKINTKLTPAELKLCALTKLRFSIKETATLLNISPDSVKSSRSTLRRKLGLKRQDNLYEFLNSI